MKKTICICLFVAGLGIAGIIGFVTGSRIDGNIEKQQPQAKNEIETPVENLEYAGDTENIPPPELAESMAVPKDYAYVIFARDGILVVYQRGGKTEYFETNIRVSDLEEKMLENLEKGIYFLDEQELYDFLESYSS